MELPKDGKLTLQITANGSVYVVNSCKIIAETYMTDAIPVPPHGRLGDLDMMEKECCHGCKNEFHKYENCIDCVLANAPTIIPAEEGK